jgi:hypothetical protein
MFPIRSQSTVPRIPTITEHFLCISAKCAMFMRVSAHFHYVHIPFHETLNEQHCQTMLLPRLLSPEPVHLMFSSHLQIFREQRPCVSAFLDDVKDFHHSHRLRRKHSGLTGCVHNCTPFVTVSHPLHFSLVYRSFLRIVYVGMERFTLRND